MSLFVEGHQIPMFERYLTSNDDLNLITKTGIYLTSDQTPKNPPTDLPDWKQRWATIVVLNHDDGQIHQFYLMQELLYHRWISKSDGPYIDWQRLILQPDYDALKARIDRISEKIGGGI